MDVITIEDSLKKAISDAAPGTQIENLEAIQSPGLHQVYRAAVQDGGTILCSLPPLSNRRILRCEYASVRAEAVSLQWLSYLCERLSGSTSPISATVDFEDKKEQRNKIRAEAISRYLPKLLDYGSAATLHRVQYNITIPREGTIISTLSSPLTSSERKSVDFQIGQMIRAMSLLRSPTSRFGNVESIVPPVPERSNLAQRRTAAQNSSETFARWSEAFGDMLNNAIQDAQVNQITASYDSIRRLLRRFTHVLNAVVEPRLVFIDAGLDTNVLVSRGGKSDGQEDDDSDESSSNDDGSSSSSSSSAGKTTSSSSEESDIKVTGIREWIKGIFGDPLLSAVFSWGPSTQLLRGFGTCLTDTLDDMDDVSKTLMRHQRSVQIRLYLYQIYHALNAISVEYIRRDDGSDPRELRARKALVEAVRALEALEEVETSKRRRPRIDIAPSKRAKTASP